MREMNGNIEELASRGQLCGASLDAVSIVVISGKDYSCASTICIEAVTIYFVCQQVASQTGGCRKQR